MIEIFFYILLLAVLLAPLGITIWLIGEESRQEAHGFWPVVRASLPWAILAVLCFPLCLLLLCIHRWGWLGGGLRALGSTVLWVGALVGSFILAMTVPIGVHETDNLADYRIVTGNYDNQSPQALWTVSRLMDNRKKRPPVVE